MLTNIESHYHNPTFGMEGHMEGWFGSSIWGPLVDLCLQGIDNFRVQRTEIKAKCSVNNNRYDAIFIGFAGVETAEFGAIEVARTAGMLNPKKKDKDAQKLMKVMVEMLISLMIHVDNDQNTVRLLQVVGIQQIGMSLLQL